VLLDVRMPGASGLDLVPQFLDLEPSLAILMLTAVNDATTAALCMQRGAFEYLIKPIDLGDLARAVERAPAGGPPYSRPPSCISGSRRRLPSGRRSFGGNAPRSSGSPWQPSRRW
jgi:DNA-binding NarL/FixJ family response regulator